MSLIFLFVYSSYTLMLLIESSAESSNISLLRKFSIEG